MVVTRNIILSLCLSLFISNTTYAFPHQENNVMLNVMTNPSNQMKSLADEDDANERDCTKDSSLSKDTEKKLDLIYQNIYMDYVHLIETYYEAGVLTKKQKMQRLAMLNQYIIHFYKNHYQWCSEHESDEWEEEWFDIDDEN